MPFLWAVDFLKMILFKDYQLRTKYFGHKRGMGQDEVGFSDLSLIFKVTAD